MSLRIVREVGAEEVPATTGTLDLAAYATSLERRLKAATDDLRAADASVRDIRNQVEEAVQRRTAGVRDLEISLARAIEEARRYAEQRDIISEASIALREAYAAVRVERDALVARCETLERAFEEKQAELAAADAAATRLVEQLAAQQGLLERARVSLHDAAEAAEAEARRYASEIDAIQATMWWRLKRALGRMLRR